MADLKEQPGRDLVVLGSGEVTRTLLTHRLVDTVVLLVRPLVLGTGIRLFEHLPAPARFELLSLASSGTGVITASYRVL